MEDELEPRLGQQLHISKPDDLTDGSLYLKPIPGYVVAVMEPIQKQAEFAALFMAAPDLLAALQGCLAELEGFPQWDQHGRYDEIQEAESRALEAIAKAKGGE